MRFMVACRDEKMRNGQAGISGRTEVRRIHRTLNHAALLQINTVYGSCFVYRHTFRRAHTPSPNER